MLKPTTWLLAALLLPLFWAGSGAPAGAEGTVVPTAEGGWRGVPDLAEDSGQFLLVSGVENAGIPGTGPGEDPGQLVLASIFDENPSGPDVELAIFDGDTSGIWDQRDDRPPVSPELGVRKPFDSVYRVYPDPTGGVARALARGSRATTDPVTPVDRDGIPEVDDGGMPLPAVYPVLTTNALGSTFSGTNAAWIELMNQEGDESARIAGSSTFVYTLRVTLEDGPNGALNGFEVNGFKVAMTGRPRLPNGTLLGFVGGVVDIRTIQGFAQSEDPLPGSTYRPPSRNDTLTNHYGGEFDFSFDVGTVCEDVGFAEGDADWNAPISPDSMFGDQNPTGIPPDDGGRYVFGTQVIDNTSLKIPLPAADEALGRHGLLWEIVDPSGSVRLSSDDSPLGHPSYSGAIQSPVAPVGDPFQTTTLSKDVLNSLSGTWTWRWRGVDSRNAIWVKARGGFGPSLGGPVVSGRVWCDDGNGIFDEGETPLAGATLVFEPVPASDFEVPIMTGADGTWQTHSLGAGTWRLLSVTPAPGSSSAFDPATPLPRTFEVDSCEGATLDVPGMCGSAQGRIAGRVWCDELENGVFDEGVDIPHAGVTVTITPSGSATPIATLTTSADGTYQSGLLDAGDYTVSVDPADPALGGPTPLSPTSVTATVVAEQTTNVDFWFRCRSEVSGHVIREHLTCDGAWEKDVESGIPGVEVVLTLLDDQGQPTPTSRTATTDATGYYEFTDVVPGTYRLTVDGDQANVVRLAANSGTTIGPLEVVSLMSYPDNDFFFCPGKIQVKVVKKAHGEACQNVIDVGDTPIAGVTVHLSGASATTTPGPFTATTDATGVATFTDLDADMYSMSIAGSQTVLVSLQPADGATAATVTLPAGGLVVIPSVWCEETCSITGTVFREAECVPWWTYAGQGIGGVTVELRRAADDPSGAAYATTTTDATGYYAFLDIPTGAYVVSVPDGQAALADLTATTDTSVAVRQCGSGVDFRYGTAGLRVHVVLDVSCCGCADGGLVATVKLEKLDAPGQGRSLELMTGPDGVLTFPRPDQPALLPGRYRVSVSATGPVVAHGDLVKEVTLGVCRPVDVTFEFCGTASLVGRVIRETVDCNGIVEAGEAGIPGVAVRLVPVSPAGAARVATTDDTGAYSFLNLPRGSYVVQVDGGQATLVDLNPSSLTQVPVTLVPPDEGQVDFTFCAPGRVCGTVYREPLGDCDGTLGDGDEPLSGVVVSLIPVDPSGPTLQRVTDERGGYCFTKLDPGRYEVYVDGSQPILVSLSGTTAGRVAVDLGPSGDETVNFGYAPQSITGYVFREPQGQCDGVYEEDVDSPIPGVSVTLIKLDTPYRGLSRVAVTNANGLYRFLDIPSGRYEVAVTGGVPADLTPSTPEVVTQPLPVCRHRRVDFGYCPPELTEICGTVFRQPWNHCDEVFDDGDTGVPGVTVRLEKTDGADAGWIREEATDENGHYCFENLPAGTYLVRVPGGQPQLVNLTPSTPEQIQVVTQVGEDHDGVDFGYCPPCPRVPCCDGDLHEVVVETRFWLDPCESWYDVYAYLKDGCGDCATEIDYAGIYFHGGFPGAVTGYNDVLTLENVWREGGWVYVRLRLTAQGAAFPRGFFGKGTRSVIVTLGDQKRQGCVELRCEKVRPGSWFTSSDACYLPDCPPARDACVLASGSWDDRSPCCSADYRVLDTYSWENWQTCDGKPECKQQSESCKAGYNTVEIEIDYWVKNHGDHHVFDAGFWSWGKTEIDHVGLSFDGTSWEGSKKSDHGLATLLYVRRIDTGDAADLWRARFLVRSCDRADGNPGVLPEQLEIRSKVDEGEHDYWLDLNYASNACLETGPILWNGEFTGVNLIRWVSVLDAAWCPPVPCDGSCDTPCSTCPPETPPPSNGKPAPKTPPQPVCKPTPKKGHGRR